MEGGREREEEVTEKHTRRPLLLDHPLEQEIQHFTAELPGAHEYYLDLA